MRVLIVCSGNANYISPFILDQADALKNRGIQIDFFLIKGKGILGYLKNNNLLLAKIKEFDPSLIHAHYGFSGLLSCLQRKIPVITTFHGCDINVPSNRFFSKISDRLSSESIFISNNLALLLNKEKPVVIPCGVDLDLFCVKTKEEARKQLGLAENKKYILFSSSFDNVVKNYQLAKESVSKVSDFDIELLELKGYSRGEVALLINAVDLVLLTSLREGSPQIVKEAMACNIPIVSTDVGDVKEIIGKTEGCYVTSSDPEDISYKIQMALDFGKRTSGRNDIGHLESGIIAKKIIDVYKSLI